MSKQKSKRLIRGLWRRTGHRWIRKVEFQIMRRPLAEPNLKIPEGRGTPVDGECDENYMYNPSLEMIGALNGYFPPARLKIFREMAADPNIDFLIRKHPEGGLWGYLMHSMVPMKDVEYKFTIPILPGQETLQFDGWVHPDYRGMLIAIFASNWVFDRRRKTGHKAIVVAVRSKDRTAMRFHDRFGYKSIGTIKHYRVGKLRWNKVQMDGR